MAFTQLLLLTFLFFLTSFNGQASAAPQRTASDCYGSSWQYAVFNYSTSATSNYDPVTMKSPSAGGQGTQNLVYHDLTSTIGGAYVAQDNTSYIRVYRNPTVIAPNCFVIPHRGYIYAAVAGTYTIDMPTVDDFAYLWTGDIAKKGWNTSNTAMTLSYGMFGTSSPGAGRYAISLVKGQSMPFRITYVQYTGAATFKISITNPAGTVIFNSTYSNSTYIVKESCTDSSAPRFPYNWGEEL